MDALILTIIATSIPLLLAATGELISEKSGVCKTWKLPFKAKRNSQSNVLPK